MKKWGLVIRVQERWSKEECLCGWAKQKSEGVVCHLEQRSRDYIDKDTHHEGTGQRGTMKYLQENCYLRIECFIANSLAALMWKWYLNSNFQLYNYSQKLQEGTDEIEINVRNLVYTWRVEMKEGRRYKR